MRMQAFIVEVAHLILSAAAKKIRITQHFHRLLSTKWLIKVASEDQHPRHRRHRRHPAAQRAMQNDPIRLIH